MLDNAVTGDVERHLAIDTNAGGGTERHDHRCSERGGDVQHAVDRQGGLDATRGDYAACRSRSRMASTSRRPRQQVCVLQPTTTSQAVRRRYRQVQDAQNLVTTNTSTVTIAFWHEPRGGVLTGTLSVAAVAAWRPSATVVHEEGRDRLHPVRDDGSLVSASAIQHVAAAYASWSAATDGTTRTGHHRRRVRAPTRSTLVTTVFQRRHCGRRKP